MHADGLHPLPAILVGAADLGEFMRGVVVPLAILLVIVVVGWFGIRWIGKWSKSDEADRVPFSLEDLRRLRREGSISEEEFERAKEQMLAAAKRPPATKTPAKAAAMAMAKDRGEGPAETSTPREGAAGKAPAPARPVPPAQLREKRTPPSEKS
ncbi:MAG: hypothetical protein GC172_01635 [Phycisphaera sp.]|nr:hypothetical protein [Phycisphaera sp.]